MQINTKTIYTNYQNEQVSSSNKQDRLFLHHINKAIENEYKNTFLESANIQFSHKNIIERSQKIQGFFKNDYEDFEKAKIEHNRRVREDENYNPELESKYFKDKKLYLAHNIFIDGEVIELYHSEYATNQSLYEYSNDKYNYDWIYQQSIIKTEDNKYENAPEFEAFVNKWIDKGLTEEEAQIRASSYALSGLLEYGNQRVIEIEPLEYGDKKQHGMHLVNNNMLKNAMFETYDSLGNDELELLVSRLFMESEHKPLALKNKKEDMFQNLIDEFGIKLKGLGGLENLDNDKYYNYKEMQFLGDINIPSQMSQLEKSFIYDVLIEYFNNHISEVETIEKEYEEEMPQTKDTLNLLIKNFEEKVKEYNQNNRALSEYTRNNRSNPY